MSLGAGVCGILLGGRWWTAPLVAAPALLFGASYLFTGQWVSTALTAESDRRARRRGVRDRGAAASLGCGGGSPGDR